MSKVLVVDYCTEAIFKIPKHIDLEDKDHVEGYWVRYQILYIKLVGVEKVIKIEPHQDVELDTKYGTNVRIQDADDWGISDDEDEEEEVEEEVEEEEVEDNPAKISKTVMCDIIDKVKAEAEAKAEAANLTRTSVINPKHICGLTGGECNGFKGCGKEVPMDETNMIGNTSFCIPCYEKLEEIITDENSEDENSDDEDEDEDEDE